MSVRVHSRDAVPCRLVVSSVTPYRAAIVDIRRRRTVHCVDALPCLVLNPDPLAKGSGQVDCRAVHYGVCVPVILQFNPINLLTAPRAFETDLHRLVNQFVAADRATKKKESMLAFASSAVSSTGSPSSPSVPQSPVRPLAASSILSAVEKFERKSIQANSRGKVVQLLKTKRDIDVAPATASNTVKESSVEPAVKTTTPPPVSDVEQPLITPPPVVSTVTAPAAKYDSCTWPSFKRPQSNAKESKDVESKEMVKKLEKVTGNIIGIDGSGVDKAKKKVDDDVGSAKKKIVKRVKVSEKKSVSEKIETEMRNGTVKVKVEGKKEKSDKSGKIINTTTTLEEELNKMIAASNEIHAVSEAMPVANSGLDSGIGSEESPPSPSPLKEEEAKSGNNKYFDQHIASPVDFAKTRFQRNTGQSVNETKFRFENGQIQNSSRDKWRPEWLPSHSSLLSAATSGDPAMEANLVQAAVDALKRDGRHQRMNQRKASSPEPTIPHPKLTVTQKQHIKERSLSPTGSSSHVPVRPFLTKGSVAERVLIFERCPTSIDRDLKDKLAAKHPAIHAASADGITKSQTVAVKEISKTASSSPTAHNLQRLAIKSSSQSTQIPYFHFPNGRPVLPKESEIILQRVATAFSNLEGGCAFKDQFGVITKACDLPLYWKNSLFIAVGGEKKGFVTSEMFLEYWKRVMQTSNDDASKFVKILSKSTRNYLLPEDFTPLIQDVVNSHPGLTFLKEAVEFHSRYVHTVIARIYYSVNRSWTGRIISPELRKSTFLQTVALLEEEDDINQITDYFSYEHFYVIYCKFWELDKDHDLYIDKSDLSRHNDHAISSRMIERIFSGAVTRGRNQKEQKMSYTEFVWFLMSEEDKRHPTSIEYWFRCMDLDGDGYLSMYELEYFYEEQLQRMEALGIETLPFKDCLCQMLDMIRPKTPGLISLSDLKRCRMTSIFFDTFFNLEKYLDHEQRDPFASQRDHDGEGGAEMSDWDRYAAEEYEFLVAEEGANEQQEDLVYEDEEDELSSSLDKLAKVTSRRSNADLEEDYTDYADYAESDDYQY
uniref:EF-hand domain-containing protein n=1 Tax=Strigamia maritima TaxID=126957 RepID=T1J4V3_STRMM